MVGCPLKLELQIVASCHVDAENKPWSSAVVNLVFVTAELALQPWMHAFFPQGKSLMIKYSTQKTRKRQNRRHTINCKIIPNKKSVIKRKGSSAPPPNPPNQWVDSHSHHQLLYPKLVFQGTEAVWPGEKKTQWLLKVWSD